MHALALYDRAHEHGHALPYHHGDIADAIHPGDRGHANDPPNMFRDGQPPDDLYSHANDQNHTFDGRDNERESSHLAQRVQRIHMF